MKRFQSGDLAELRRFERFIAKNQAAFLTGSVFGFCMLLLIIAVIVEVRQ